MPFSPDSREAKRNEAFAAIQSAKDQAKGAYQQLANASGALAAVAGEYGAAFDPVEDAAIIDGYQVAKDKIDGGLEDLRARGVDALGTSTEV